MQLIYTHCSSYKDLHDSRLRGFRSVLTVASDDLGKFDLPLIWGEDVVVIATDPSILATLLPDEKIHILTGDPGHTPQLSSQGVLFSDRQIPDVRRQVIVLPAFDETIENHSRIIEFLLAKQLMGVCSKHPASWLAAFQKKVIYPLKGPRDTGIALITFDLDGVLVESKELHYDAFNLALNEAGPEFVMSQLEHDAHYCGLSTKQKLRMLTLNKNLPPEKHEFIWKRKQYHTLELMKTTIKRDAQIVGVLEALRDAGYPIAVASNCVRDSVFYLLSGIGVHDLISCYFSNEDVSAAKPDPEIYLAAAEHFGICPDEMLVVEDSSHGKQAALLAGAHLCPVASPFDVTIEYLSIALSTRTLQPSCLNIIIPMAGVESLFVEGSPLPKFLINISGKSLLERIVENVRPNRPHRFIFIARQYQARTYKLAEICVKACKFNPVLLLEVKAKSASAVETVLVAKDLINSDDPLLICNLNMWPEFKASLDVDTLSYVNADCILTHFESANEAFSYVTVDANMRVQGVSTKTRSSNLATTGYTIFRNGSKFVELSELLLASKREGESLYIEDVVRKGLQSNLRIASARINCTAIRNAEDITNLTEQVSITQR